MKNKKMTVQIKLVGFEEYQKKLDIFVEKVAELEALREELNSTTIGYEIVRSPLEESQ